MVVRPLAFLYALWRDAGHAEHRKLQTLCDALCALHKIFYCVAAGRGFFKGLTKEREPDFKMPGLYAREL
jgi:hypothetical protein